MKKKIMVLFCLLVANLFAQDRSEENGWMHGTAFSWGAVWPLAEGYIHGLTFTGEKPISYPLGIKVDQDNKHALYLVHRGAMLGGAISLAMWRPPAKYFFTARGLSRTFGVWCVWTSIFNATIRKVQTGKYFPADNQKHGYTLDIAGLYMRFQEPPAWVRKGQLVAGLTLYFLPDIIDLFHNQSKAKIKPAPDLLADKNKLALNLSPHINLTKGERFYGGEINIVF